ncbi:hypothetical protein MKX03_018720 [Papaver bracteatum]|nr:hypothetical protein MKX03_018720 [Papaver bracteatum]
MEDEQMLYMVPSEGNSTSRKTRKMMKHKKTKEKICSRNRRLTDQGVKTLELHFLNDHTPATEKKLEIASQRYRWKTSRIEEKYLELKRVHEAVILEKDAENNQLLSEVSCLKERIMHLENELQQPRDYPMPTVTSSCFTTLDGADPMFMPDEFDDNGIYVPSGMEWVKDV